ncbi:MAG TPA: type II toxin-antitoxin system HicB family antitoxin [Thermoanaerobaculia bacterium]|nr:type II toxin-antitoxin system HicB family antitoxin [Thermoanaerobaculia bacterium]
MSSIKIIVEKHDDGYVAYPVGMRGVVIGEGDTYDQALADVRSAIQFHIETFGAGAFENDSPVLDAFVAETEVTV